MAENSDISETAQVSFLRKNSRWITGSIGVLVIVLGLVALVSRIDPPVQKSNSQQASSLPVQETAPSFDVVRINKNGSAIFSGTATAGATVVLSLNEAPFAETQTDIEGDWIHTQGAGLQPGKYIMRISARLQGFADNTPDTQLLIDLGGIDASDERALPNAQAVVYAASVKRGLRLLQNANTAKGIGLSNPIEDPQTEVIQVTEPPVVAAQEPVVQEPIAVTEEAPVEETPPAVPEIQQTIIAEEPVAEIVIQKAKFSKAKKTITIEGVASPDVVIRAFLNANPPKESAADAGGSWAITLPIANVNGATADFTALQIRDGLEVSRRVVALKIPAWANEKASEQSVVEQSAVSVPTITVKTGDSLWSLAQRAYNDGTKYKKILAANKDQISSHKNLKPGMVLKVPN